MACLTAQQVIDILKELPPDSPCVALSETSYWDFIRKITVVDAVDGPEHLMRYEEYLPEIDDPEGLKPKKVIRFDF